MSALTNEPCLPDQRVAGYDALFVAFLNPLMSLSLVSVQRNLQQSLAGGPVAPRAWLEEHVTAPASRCLRERFSGTSKGTAASAKGPPWTVVSSCCGCSRSDFVAIASHRPKATEAIASILVAHCRGAFVSADGIQEIPAVRILSNGRHFPRGIFVVHHFSLALIHATNWGWSKFVYRSAVRDYIVLQHMAMAQTLGGGWASVRNAREALRAAVALYCLAHAIGDEACMRKCRVFIGYAHMWRGNRAKSTEIFLREMTAAAAADDHVQHRRCVAALRQRSLFNETTDGDVGNNVAGNDASRCRGGNAEEEEQPSSRGAEAVPPLDDVETVWHQVFVATAPQDTRCITTSVSRVLTELAEHRPVGAVMAQLREAMWATR